MSARFIQKRVFDKKPPFRLGSFNVEPTTEKIVSENKDNKTIENMTTKEKIEAANSVLSTPVKRIKKDKGLIERTESSTTILTEDNKELLKD